jgi:hypothetical protein
MANPEQVRSVPLLGPTAASSTLVAATCLTALLDAWTSWYRHGVTVDYVASAPGVWVGDLSSADSTGRTVDVLYVLAMAGAGVAVLVWLSRLRASTRLRGHAVHPLRRMLAVGGWFALSLFAVATTVLSGADASVPELETLATVDSFVAVVQCVVGMLLVVVIRKATRLATTETNQPGPAMRG